MEWTQVELDRLTACAKRVTEPPSRQWKLESGAKRKSLRAEAVAEPGLRFRVFLRINQRFPENFSIGLVCLQAGGELPLLRCNGPHGQHGSQGFSPSEPHYGYHEHRLRAADAADGVLVERWAERTSHYASFEEAVLHFARAAGLPELAELLQVGPQLQLFDAALHGDQEER